MRAAGALALIAAIGAAATVPVAVAGTAPAEVAGRARQNWMLKCQGCHQADGRGGAQTSPALAGAIGRFATLPEGRDYLVRVPGVATAALPDDQLAELLNWTLTRFDAAHLPADFAPYTAKEVGRLRLRPLRTEAAQTRADLLARLDAAATIDGERK